MVSQKITSDMDAVIQIVASSSEGSVNRMYGAGDASSARSGSALDGSVISSSSSSVWTAKVIFQALSPLSKQYVMRLLFVDSPVPIDQWVNDSTLSASHTHIEALKELASLRIVVETFPSSVASPVIFTPSQSVRSPAAQTPTPVVYSHYTLNPYFRQSLRIAVIHPTEPWENLSDISQKTVAVPPTALIEELFALRWDNLLRLLVCAPTLQFTPTTVYKDVKHNKTVIKVEEFGDPLEFMRKFLLMSKLATEDVDVNGYKVLKITSKGYEFMLKDTLSQVWTLIHASLSRLTDKSDYLGLLFMLSACRYGDGYDIELLSAPHKQRIFEMSLCGLVLIPTLNSSKFYPTRVIIDVLFRKAMIISNIPVGHRGQSGYSRDISQLWGQSSVQSTAPTPSADAAGGGVYTSAAVRKASMTIIVETNNQVVAYVHNDLHFAMLSLFVEVFLRTPNMVMGRITRDKAKAAYKIGLTSQQIIDFLCSHAHPVVIGNIATESIVPENVCDLLKVWENETYRLNCTEAVLFMLADIRGLTLDHYNKIVEHMQRLGVLLWCLESKRLVAVTPAGAGQLQTYAQEALGLYYVY
jgi:hypothetical protein